jgi:hypothetical protein
MITKLDDSPAPDGALMPAKRRSGGARAVRSVLHLVGSEARTNSTILRRHQRRHHPRFGAGADDGAAIADRTSPTPRMTLCPRPAFLAEPRCDDGTRRAGHADGAVRGTLSDDVVRGPITPREPRAARFEARDHDRSGHP